MGDTANVRAWQGGEVFVAPVGSTGPTNTTTALDAAFKTLGILDQDVGAEESRTETKTDKYGWGVGKVRTLYSKHSRSFKVVAMETNATVMKLVNQGSTSTAVGGVTTTSVKSPTHTRKAFVIEETDGDITRRRWIKTADVSVTGTIKDAETDTTGYELTIDVYPDADTNELWTEITDDPEMINLTSA